MTKELTTSQHFAGAESQSPVSLQAPSKGTCSTFKENETGPGKRCPCVGEKIKVQRKLPFLVWDCEELQTREIKPAEESRRIGSRSLTGQHGFGKGWIRPSVICSDETQQPVVMKYL